MRIRTIFYMVFIACLLSCCTQRKEECVHGRFLFEYSKGDFESDIPPVNMFHLYFAEINNDSIIITSNFYLYQIYKKHYLSQFSNFHMFLCSLYDNELILEREYLDETMLRNSILFKKETIFENMDSSELKGCYFDDSRYLKTNLDFTEDEMFSLLYYFFRNEYYVFFSDYSGLYSIEKNDDDPESE